MLQIVPYVTPILSRKFYENLLTHFARNVTDTDSP